MFSRWIWIMKLLWFLLESLTEWNNSPPLLSCTLGWALTQTLGILVTLCNHIIIFIVLCAHGSLQPHLTCQSMSLCMSSGRFGCSSTATTQHIMMNIPLLKTSEVEAIIVDDSDSEQDEPSKDETSMDVEPTPKHHQINTMHSKQLIACYHAVGPIAWQRIITNLINVSKETAEQLDMVPWGATTPLMVTLLMARRDALDLVKALPALMQDHPHMKFQLFMLVSTRDSEPTKDACLRHLAETYLNGACAFPGIKPLRTSNYSWGPASPSRLCRIFGFLQWARCTHCMINLVGIYSDMFLLQFPHCDFPKMLITTTANAPVQKLMTCV